MFLKLLSTSRRRRALTGIVVVTGLLLAGVASAQNITTTLRPGDTTTVRCEDGTLLSWDRASDLEGTLTCQGPTTTTTAPPTTTTTAPPTTTTTAPPTTTTTAPPAPGGQPDPVNCTGYPEWRTFTEAQSWWVDSENPFPGQHVHLGTCFPLMEKVRGNVHFDLKVMAHGKPGAITKIAVEAFGNGSIQSKAVNLNCATMDCTWWVPFDFDTTKTSYNGRWEFRMRAIVANSPNGSKQYNSTRWHAILDNPGKPVRDASESLSRSPGGAGWYTGIGYMNVFCGPAGYDFLRRPQSGVVSLTCKFDQQTAFASIDGNFHAGDPGKVVLDSSTGGTKTITIDTRTLSNGKHRLFLRTDAKGSSPAGVGSGAQALTFEVQN